MDEGVDLVQILLRHGAADLVFDVVVHIKVVLDGSLVPARDESDPVHPGLPSLLHSILDEGLVQDRQHLFRHCLGCGKKPRAVTSRGKETLPQHEAFSVDALSSTNWAGCSVLSNTDLQKIP